MAATIYCITTSMNTPCMIRLRESIDDNISLTFVDQSKFHRDLPYKFVVELDIFASSCVMILWDISLAQLQSTHYIIEKSIEFRKPCYIVMLDDTPLSNLIKRTANLYFKPKCPIGIDEVGININNFVLTDNVGTQLQRLLYPSSLERESALHALENFLNNPSHHEHLTQIFSYVSLNDTDTRIRQLAKIALGGTQKSENTITKDEEIVVICHHCGQEDIYKKKVLCQEGHNFSRAESSTDEDAILLTCKKCTKRLLIYIDCIGHR